MPTLPGWWIAPGMMPILHSPGVITPGQFGPISANIAAGQRGPHLQHVQHRNALGDADDDLDAGIRRLEDRIGREGGRHVDHAGIGAGLAHRVVHGVEHRPVEVLLAALARRDAADQLGAVGDGLFGVEGALLAGEALADDLGVLVDSMLMVCVPLAQPCGRNAPSSAASVRSAAVSRSSPLSASSLRPCSTLVPSRRTTTGTLMPTS